MLTRRARYCCYMLRYYARVTLSVDAALLICAVYDARLILLLRAMLRYVITITLRRFCHYADAIFHAIRHADIRYAAQR